MLTKRIEDLFSGLFTRSSHKSSLFNHTDTKLQLPLERTAVEQIKYAQWLYGGDVKKLLAAVNDLEYSETPDDYIQFDYVKNTFTFKQPEGWESDEFYFLFDYIKEIYIQNNYRVTDAIKEACSGGKVYKDIERYILIDSHTHHLVKLEVIAMAGEKTKIVGWGYPMDINPNEINQPNFFKIVKEVFEYQY